MFKLRSLVITLSILAIATGTMFAATPLPMSKPKNDSKQPETQPTADAKQAKEKQESAEEVKVREMETQKKLLSAESQLRMEALHGELAESILEKERLQIENNLRDEQQKKSLSATKAESERLSVELEKEIAVLKLSLQKMNAEKERLSLENLLQSEEQKREIAQMTAKLEKEVAAIKAENERLEMDMARENVLQKKALQKLVYEKEMLAAENEKKKAELESQELEFKTMNSKTTREMAELTAKTSLRNQKEIWKNTVNNDIKYPENPLDENGVLRISDRRIELNGAIIDGTAKYITDRIHYFNNKSKTQPIFIVIDNSPGGSVMQGYRILKAMEASEAPIHVVVKSFAASMAAAITTLAEHSYAYPSAIILHHQMSGGGGGNLTVQREQLEELEKWADRLAKPVAKKMGISVDKLYKEMYAHNSEGNWNEFADDAVKLKWVDTVVSEIREEGIIKHPAGGPPQEFSFLWKASNDEKRQPPSDKILLPTPAPFDFYFLYNPRGQYQWR